MSDNEKIALFMGASKGPRLGRFSIPNKEELDYHLDDLRYATSWDWLMPVVDKIQTPEIIKNRIVREPADVTIFYKNCKIEYMSEDLDYCESSQGETKSEAVYKAVVQFIDWYNQQKP